MVLAVVASLASLVKARLSKAQVDNSVFKLHYRWTTSFCFLCCALIAASDFIGSPIQCFGADPAVTTYCWVSSTYTINTTNEDNGITLYAAYGSKFNGIGTFNPKIHEKKFHAYYQWVPFILFFQGCLFYLPHEIWKTIEGKQLENLLQGLHMLTLDDSVQRKRDNILKYLKSSWGLNKKYSFGYLACEILNFLNVLSQMFLLDKFFAGMFWKYGAEILFLPTMDDGSRFDPMIQTFPRVTKCEFATFGPSGSIELKDFICILPQNLLNEKIFLVMWVWFVFLLCATGVQLMLRVATFLSSDIRVKLIEQRGKMGSSKELANLVRQMYLGDFFLLYNIGKNVDITSFKTILKGLIDFQPRPTPSTPVTTLRSRQNNGFLDDFGGNTLNLKFRKRSPEGSTV